MGNQVDIAVLATSLSGGIGRYKLNMAKAFLSCGYRVAIIVEKPGGDFYQQIPDEVRVVHLKTTHTIIGVLPLAAILRELNPRVLIPSVVRLTLLSVRAKLLARVATKIFPVVHNTYTVKDSHLSSKKMAKRRRKVARYYPKCDGVVCVSRGVQLDIEHYAGQTLKNSRVIYNPMAFDEIVSLKEEAVDHPWLLGGEKVILNAGRFSKAKNLPLLIESFTELRKRQDAKLLLLSDSVEELEELCLESPFREDIDVLPFQSNPFKFMSRSDLIVLCSNFEGFGNVLVEALACGTPVVSTDCPSGPAEILEGGRIGKLVPMRDVKALAEAMSEQLNESVSKEAEASITASIQERFRDIKIAQQYLDFFGFSRAA